MSRFHLSASVLLLFLAVATADAKAEEGKPAEPAVEPRHQLVKAASRAYDHMTAKWQAGTTTTETVYLWSRRWMEAELATLTKPADRGQRIEAITKHIARMSEMEERGIELKRMTRFFSGVLPAMRYYVIEGELMLEKERLRNTAKP